MIGGHCALNGLPIILFLVGLANAVTAFFGPLIPTTVGLQIFASSVVFHYYARDSQVSQIH